VKVETLSKKFKEAEERSSQREKELKKHFEEEMRKNKDAWAAGEIIRREKWESERSHEIKAQTVRGIEPEI
jgi:5-azacytidine-induced protein 1